MIHLFCVVQFLGAQCIGPFNGATNCEPSQSQLSIVNSTDIEFTFDSFGEVFSGIVRSGQTIVRVKAVNNPSATCKWNLIMYVNNASASTPNTEWEKLNAYGSSTAASPSLNLIQVRVSNACGTPQQNGVWQSFVALNASPIVIIQDLSSPGLNLPGSCSGQQVNTAGSYLTNYSEYTFTIDYKIAPGFIYAPGRYTLRISFCLSEM